MFIVMIVVDFKKVYIYSYYLSFKWTSLVNFSYFPADKYKLEQRRNNVETTSNFNVEKTFNC